MLILILFLIVGSILAYISKNNLELVSVHIGSYVVSNVPLFYVIIGSLLIGLVFSYIIYIIHSISASLALRSKDHEIKKNKDEVLELTKRVHQLELENEKLKRSFGSGSKRSPSTEPEDPNAL